MAYLSANSGYGNVGLNITGDEPAHEQTGVCDVHRLIEGDTRPRLVRFCSLCQAWMCSACRRNPVRRARAALARRFGH